MFWTFTRRNSIIKLEDVVSLVMVVKLAMHSQSPRLLLDLVKAGLPSNTMVQVHRSKRVSIGHGSSGGGPVSSDVASAVQDSVLSADLDPSSIGPSTGCCSESTTNNVVLSKAPNPH